MKVNETKLESLEAVHTHTHTHQVVERFKIQKNGRSIYAGLQTQKVPFLELFNSLTHTHTSSASGFLAYKNFEYVNRTQEKCIC